MNRWLRIQLTIVDAQPDIIVLQEMDHMADGQRDLARLGYECGMPGKVYQPAHEVLEDGGKARSPAAFLSFLEGTGVAFMPKTAPAALDFPPFVVFCYVCMLSIVLTI